MGRCGHRPLRIPLSPTVTSPFSRGTRDSSALTGTSSIRGGFLLAPLQRSWQAVGLTEESRANNVRPYGGLGLGLEKGKIVEKEWWWFNGLEKGTGRCGHRPLRIPPSAPHGASTSLFKGGSGERCSPLRWWELPFRKGIGYIIICVPENKNPPEGGTGSLSAVRKIVSLRWIGGKAHSEHAALF